MRLLRLTTLACLLLATFAGNGTAGEWFVLETNPPAIARVSGVEVHSRTPLDHPPERAYLSADGQRLFVLCQIKAKKNDPEGDRSQIVVVSNVGTKVELVIPVSGKVTNFGPLWNTGHWFAFGPGGDAKRRLPGVAYLIDGRTLRYREYSIDNHASAAVWTRDLSRLFVLNEGQDRTTLLTVFDATSQKPAATVELQTAPNPPAGSDERRIGYPGLLATSPDWKWLYAVDRGYYDHGSVKQLGMQRTGDKSNRKHRRDGFVHVVDMTTGKLAASHPLGISPWKVYSDERLGTVSVLAFAEDGARGKLHEFQGDKLVRSVDVGVPAVSNPAGGYEWPRGLEL